MRLCNFWQNPALYLQCYLSVLQDAKTRLWGSDFLGLEVGADTYQDQECELTCWCCINRFFLDISKLFKIKTLDRKPRPSRFLLYIKYSTNTKAQSRFVSNNKYFIAFRDVSTSWTSYPKFSKKRSFKVKATSIGCFVTSIYHLRNNFYYKVRKQQQSEEIYY